VKNKRLPLFFGIAALFLYSCDLFVDPGNGNRDGGAYPPASEYKIFRAQNFLTGSYYNVDAMLLYEGAKCTIWREIASRTSPYAAQTMANTYDNSIYPNMMSAFGFVEEFPGEDTVVTRNTMEQADYLGDGDGKLCILLLDIRDSYGMNGNQSYVAGYFWFGNLYSKSTYPDSNESDMIYIDTNPGIPGSEQSNAILAHEMQHLMNFVTGMVRGRGTMDTWVDEGLSGAAEYVATGKHNENRIAWYKDDQEGTIRKGNNFFVWNNYTSSNPMILLDDYSTVYLFFNWLRLQASTGIDIFRTIINSPHSDYRAVTAAAANVINSGYNNNWPLLLRDWMAANYVNAPSGRYGYKNDPMLRDINARVLSGVAGSSYPLAPGEGIYTQKSTMPGTVANIGYAGLPSRGSLAAPNDLSASGSSALLSYNTNTNRNALGSPCYPFSVETGPSLQPDAGMDMTSVGLSFKRSFSSGPYPISVGEMLRLNGHEELQR